MYFTHQLLPQAPTRRKMENKQTTSVLMLAVGNQSHQCQRKCPCDGKLDGGEKLLPVLKISRDKVLQRPRLELSLGGWA